MFGSTATMDEYNMTQSVAFKHWIELLREAGHEILPENIIFQDPAFQAYDVDFITSFGYKVVGGFGLAYGAPDDETRKAVEDPTAQNMMTEEPFAFIPCGTPPTVIDMCVEMAHLMLLITSFAYQPRRHSAM
jgi:hypothetical protein